MAAPGSTNALRAETFENLQLNAGIFIKNLQYDTVENATELATLIQTKITDGSDILGATRGGGTFTVTKETREPEIDGMRYRFKGGTFVDSVDAYLSTTLVEFDPDTFAKAIGGKKTNQTGGKRFNIRLETAITDDDYLTNLCWIGDLADGRLVLICLKNAINTADFTMTFTDKGEGTIGVEFHATQAAVNDYDEAPFEVCFFSPVGS